MTSGWKNSIAAARGPEIVDTNVFIYASSPAEGDKYLRARDLIDDLIGRDGLAVSVQVLNEFYRNATRPNKPPSLSHDEASRIVRNIIASARVFPLDGAVTLRALDILPRYSLSFWDALIWAAAKENGVAVIHTEGAPDGRVFEGVLYRNPFAAMP